MSKLSENLKNMRLLRNLSTSAVAAKLGCSPNTLTNWEKGKISPPAEAVEKLCNLYDISPSQIFGWDENKELNDFIKHKQHILVEINKLTKAREVLDKQIADYHKMLEDDPADVDLSNPPEGLDLNNSMTNSMKRRTVFRN